MAEEAKQDINMTDKTEKVSSSQDTQTTASTDTKINKKLLMILLLIILLGAMVVAYIVIKSRKAPPEVPVTEGPTPTQSLEDELESATLALAVYDYTPGDEILVDTANMREPGFIVIHEDDNGPGAIIGNSDYLQAGANSNVLVELNRSTVPGEKTHVMLHVDNGDGEFDPQQDQPVMEGEVPFYMTFIVSEE